MWIRSQDKTKLVKAKSIEAYNARVFVSISSDEQTIDICIGKYESEERAIEVLDEIQENINVLEYDKVYKSRNEKMYAQGRYVYQMPEK